MSALVVAAALLAATAACSRGPDPAEVVAATAATTPRAGTSKLVFALRGGAPGSGDDLVADGAFDFAAGRGTYTIDIPAGGGESLGRLDVVQDGLVLYARFPPELARLLRARPWVKIDVVALSRQATGDDLGGLTQARSADPTVALAFLRGASDETRRVGTETLRGARATRYRTTLDLEKAAADSPPEGREGIRRASEALGTARLPAEVWVDGRGRMRKMQYSIDLSKVPGARPPEAEGGADPAGAQTFVFELFGFGTPVHAEVPPPEETTDLGQLLAAPPAGEARPSP